MWVTGSSFFSWFLVMDAKQLDKMVLKISGTCQLESNLELLHHVAKNTGSEVSCQHLLE